MSDPMTDPQESPVDVLAVLDALTTPADPKHSREDLVRVIESLRETEAFAHLKVYRCEMLIEDMYTLLQATLDAARCPFPISDYRIPKPVLPHAMTWDDTEGNVLPPETTLLDAIPHVLQRAHEWRMAFNRRDLEKIAIEDIKRKYG